MVSFKILDGALGSELIRRGLTLPKHNWSADANITRPKIVQKIHQEYVDAGTDYITANTFRTTPRAYKKIGASKPEEAATCTPYLERQIELLQPKIMLALGRIAAQWLLKSNSSIGSLRGREFVFGEQATPLIVSYHPAYLLRSPLAKAKAWEDLVLVRQILQVHK